MCVVSQKPTEAMRWPVISVSPPVTEARRRLQVGHEMTVVASFYWNGLCEKRNSAWPFGLRYENIQTILKS